jgi:MoaA/NifB/PqqE/SkfB family radical SAM enzyme
MKKQISVSLNLSYYCNFACNFCYLTTEQLNDSRRLVPLHLKAMLLDLQERYEIVHVDIYGGEVLLLPVEYMKDIKDLLHVHGIVDISLITNLSLINETALDEDYQLTVSYDSTAREKSEAVFMNLALLPREVSILTLASRTFLATISVDDYVATMNLMSNVNSVEIKPYSENQANHHNVPFTDFEDFVYSVAVHPDRNFHFENESLLERVLSSNPRNAYSDDHIYITPLGQYAVLDFDEHDREKFVVVKDLDAYEAWCVAEKLRVDANLFCSACEYKGHCLSEHLREVKSLDNSCNGFHSLIKRWSNDDVST